MHSGRDARPRSLKGVYSGNRNPEIKAESKEMRKILSRFTQQARTLVTIDQIPSLERFQVHPSRKSRIVIVYSFEARMLRFRSSEAASQKLELDSSQKKQASQCPSSSRIWRAVRPTNKPHSPRPMSVPLGTPPRRRPTTSRVRRKKRRWGCWPIFGTLSNTRRNGG